MEATRSLRSIRDSVTAHGAERVVLIKCPMAVGNKVREQRLTLEFGRAEAVGRNASPETKD